MNLGAKDEAYAAKAARGVYRRNFMPRIKKGSISTITQTMPDGEVVTTKVRVLSAKTKKYKNGVEWTLIHCEEIA